MKVLIKIITGYKYYLLLGIRVTIVVSLCASMLGMIFGTILALVKRTKFKPLKWLTSLYVEIVRGTPVLVQISMVYYGLPMIGVSFPNVEVGGVTFDRLFVRG